MKDTAVLMLDTSGPGLLQAGLPGPRGGRPSAGDPGRRHGAPLPLPGPGPAVRPLLRFGHHPHRGRPHRQKPGSGPEPLLLRSEVELAPPTQAWMDAADEAQDREFHGNYEIWGGDIDPAAVELARHNAQLAEVDDIVRFEAADARTFHWGGMYGRIVTNPPYGERIMERREAEELYRAFGKAWTKFPETWKLYLLSSHTEFERTFGKTADRKRKLYNGMLKCDLFLYGVK